MASDPAVNTHLNWTHIAVSFMPMELALRLYINGDLVCQATDNLAYFGSHENTSLKFSSTVMSKYLDNVALYEEALTKEQIWIIFGIGKSHNQYFGFRTEFLEQ